MDLHKFKTLQEALAYAKVCGFDRGRTDRLIIEWAEHEKNLLVEANVEVFSNVVTSNTTVTSTKL